MTPLCDACGRPLTRGRCQTPTCELHDPLPAFRIVADAGSGEQVLHHVRMADASWAATEAAQRLGVDEDTPVRVLSVTREGVFA